MAVSIRIKQVKKLFKKNLDVYNIIELWKNSCINSCGGQSVGLIGVCDEYFRIDGDFLNPTKSNNFSRMNKLKASSTFILFDRLNLNRGFDFTFDNNDILLNLNYPATLSEIKSYYNLVNNICKKIGNNVFIRDDYDGSKYVDVSFIEELINKDYINSYNYLKQIYNEPEYITFNLLGVMNPICISKNDLSNLGIGSSEESESINVVMTNYEKYLNDLQQKDRFFSVPRCYKTDNGTICVFPCPPKCETIISTDPEYDVGLYKKLNPDFLGLNNISGYYVTVEYNKKFYQVDYMKFIRMFNDENNYDSKHIVINYSDTDIKDLIDNSDTLEL